MIADAAPVDMGVSAGAASVTLADPTTFGPPDFVRDQWQRPLVIPADGGKPLPYTRSSAAAKTIEDTFALEMWARRNVAYGMAKDKSLIARTLALGGDPSTWDHPTKAKANGIVEDAAAVALAHKAADIGTAVHRMTELVDRGLQVDAGPWEDDITAYVNTLAVAGLSVVEVECRLVCDELEMAGTADRILRNGTRHYIADIKTGETVDYGGLGWAAQLACYAHSDLYDVDTGKRTPTPRLDQTTGLIVHLPAGKGECTLYEIDLVAGYRAAQLANEIRAVRRAARRWICPYTQQPTAGAAEPPDPSPANQDGDGIRRRNLLLQRYGKLDPLRQQMFVERGIDRDDLDAIEQALDALEPHPVDPELLKTDEVAAISERALKLSPEHKTLLDSFAREALAAGECISYRFEPHERNTHICRALLSACEAGLDESDIYILIEVVIGVEPAMTVGAALGALTLDEAIKLDKMAADAVP